MGLLLCPHCDQNQIAILPNDNSEFMIIQIMLIKIITLFIIKLQIYNPNTFNL